MTDKLQIRSEEYDIDIDNEIWRGGVIAQLEDKQHKAVAKLYRHHAVKIINHLIKVFDVSRDEVNL